MAVRQFAEKESVEEFSGPFPLPEHPLVHAFNRFCSTPLSEKQSPYTHALYRTDGFDFLTAPEVLDVFDREGLDAAVKVFLSACQAKGLMPSTIRRKMQAVKRIMGDDGKAITLPRYDKGSVSFSPPLTGDQVAMLYAYTEPDFRASAIATLGLETGAKSEEIATLNRDDIIPSFDNSSALVRFKKRSATLDGLPAERVLRQRDERPVGKPMFRGFSNAGHHREDLTRQGVFNALKGYGNQIGRPDLNLTVLRGTYITNGIRQGRFKDRGELAKDLAIQTGSATTLFQRYSALTLKG